MVRNVHVDNILALSGLPTSLEVRSARKERALFTRRPEDILFPAPPPIGKSTVSDIVQPDVSTMLHGNQLLMFYPMVAPSHTVATMHAPVIEHRLSRRIIYAQRYIRWGRENGIEERYTSLASFSIRDNDPTGFIIPAARRLVSRMPTLIREKRLAYNAQTGQPREVVYYAQKNNDNVVAVHARRVIDMKRPQFPKALWTYAEAVDDDAIAYEAVSKKIRYIGDPIVAQWIAKHWGFIRVLSKRDYSSMLARIRRDGGLKITLGGITVLVGTIAEAQAYSLKHGKRFFDHYKVTRY